MTEQEKEYLNLIENSKYNLFSITYMGMDIWSYYFLVDNLDAPNYIRLYVYFS